MSVMEESTGIVEQTKAGAPQKSPEQLRIEKLERIVLGGEEPSEADMARMMEIQKELDAFGQELDKRVFGRSEH